MALTANDRSIAGFTMAGHALVHWFETSIPILLVVWIAQFDVSVAVLGLVVALGYAPFGLGALPGGILADRYGTKRLVCWSLVGMSVAFLALAGAAVADSIWAIAVGLVLWGVAASVYHPAGLSLISTGVEDRGTVFAWHGIAGNAGIALGPFAAATLLIVVGWDAWYYVPALLAIPGFLAAAYGFGAEFDPTAAVADGALAAGEDGADDRFSLPDFLADSRTLFASAFAIVFVIVTFEGLYYRGMLTYLPEVLHNAPAIADLEFAPELERYEIDVEFYLYVGLLVAGMGGQYVGGKLTNRVSPAAGMGALFVVLATLALAFVPATAAGAAGLWPLVALCVVFGICLFAIQPFYQEAVAVYTPPESRGLSYGYTYLGEFGLGSASIALGGLALGVSQAWFFGLLAAFAAVGAALAVGLYSGVDRRRGGIGSTADD
ncbi:MFS transporter [Halobacteria archaeon AArc-dxtr1]|nr:MFS transporter [Halobacteria archaeon AArc-dxtr1]